MIRKSCLIMIIFLAGMMLCANSHAAPTAVSDLAAAEGQFIANCPENPSVAVYDASVAGMLTPDLLEAGKAENISLVERERLKDLLAEQCLYEILDKETAAEPGKLKFAKFIVTVDADLKSPPPIHVSIKLIQTNTGEILYESSKTITGDNPIAALDAYLGEAAKEIAKVVGKNNYACKDLDKMLEDLAKLQGCVRFHLTMDFDFKNTGGCNFDHHTADIAFSTQINDGAEKESTGNGAGTMTHEPINRCPGTSYGGLRTVNEPFLVGVESYTDGDGVHILLTPHDLNENYFKDGRAYYSGSMLRPAFPHSKGKNVSGTLAHFILPKDLDKVGKLEFALKTPPMGGGWVEGSAMMELVGQSDGKGQSIVDRVFGGCQLTAQP